MSNAAQSRDENADVNPRDDEEDTPLSFQAAAKRGDEAAVKLLLEQGGVDIDSRDAREKIEKGQGPGEHGESQEDKTANQSEVPGQGQAEQEPDEDKESQEDKTPKQSELPEREQVEEQEQEHEEHEEVPEMQFWESKGRKQVEQNESSRTISPSTGILSTNFKSPPGREQDLRNNNRFQSPSFWSPLLPSSYRSLIPSRLGLRNRKIALEDIRNDDLIIP